ncbi:MAG: hypothetical protein HYU64_12375, partial [Armatimonadetes bacterium]|nr:hypothetical protein [Armatimonadota bacterium]
MTHVLSLIWRERARIVFFLVLFYVARALANIVVSGQTLILQAGLFFAVVLLSVPLLPLLAFWYPILIGVFNYHYCYLAGARGIDPTFTVQVPLFVQMFKDLLMAPIFILWATRLLLVRDNSPAGKSRFLPAFYMLMFFLVFVVFLDASQKRLAPSLVGLRNFIEFMPFAFLPSLFLRTESRLRTFVACLLGTGFIAALLGIYESLSGGSYYNEAFSFGRIYRAASTFNNPNNLGWFLIMVTLYGLTLLGSRKQVGMGGVFLMFVLGTFLLCALLTFSRGTLVGLLVTTTVYALYTGRKWILRGVLACCVIAFLALPDAYLARYQRTFEEDVS